jgi:lipopolysaccharide/colanic/teichoic acid biosynthesis glycosyltransferase
MLKRLFDLVFAVIGLVVLSPVFLAVALWVKMSDRGPVLFRQERVGLGGRRFWMLKFRSMVVNARTAGPSITRKGDARITPPGRILRKTKLDELPQLWNVLVGEMSFVGPRPEVPEYVAKYTPEQRRVLALKPGITDLATLEFRNEEEMLSEVGRGQKAKAVERFYLEYCVPRKIQLNLEYARRASLWQDVRIILRTLFPIFEAKRRTPAHKALRCVDTPSLKDMTRSAAQSQPRMIEDGR